VGGRRGARSGKLPSPAPFHTFEDAAEAECGRDQGDRLSTRRSARWTPETEEETNLRLGLILASIAVGDLSSASSSRAHCSPADTIVDVTPLLTDIASSSRRLRSDNLRIFGKLRRHHGADVRLRLCRWWPIYKTICTALGIKRAVAGRARTWQGRPARADPRSAAKHPDRHEPHHHDRVSTRIRAGPVGVSHPAKRSVDVHPGELTTVIYEFRNVPETARWRRRRFPSYAADAGRCPYFKQARVLLLQPVHAQNRASPSSGPVRVS